MSYAAEVFNLMIASPSDVATERSIVRDVIYEWNAVHSKSRNIVLLPVGWESHTSPEMGSNPQDIINSQILDKCDLLVGVFWTRIGTQTTEYASGTVEEIEKHIDSGKPAMLYFSSKPVVTDLLDIKQIQELRKFKQSCRDKGLFEIYDDYTDFQQKFYRHLQLKLIEHPLFKDITSESITTSEQSTTQFPNLTKEARILLKEASLDPHGTVVNMRYISATVIETNKKSFVKSNNRREIALWEGAINELVNENLLVDREYKGEFFEITSLGYQLADMIEI